jgi:hypothetical protein
MRWLGLALAALVFSAPGMAFLLGSQFAVGSDTASVRIGSATVPPGGSVTVPLEALNVPSPGPGALTVDIVYDASIEPADWSAGPGLDIVQCSLNYAPHAIRCTGICAAGVSGDMLAVNITFHAVGQPGVCTALDITVATFTDPDGNPLPVIDEDGQICILPEETSTPTPTPTPTTTPTPTQTPAPAPDGDGDGLPNNVDPCPSDDDCDDDGLMDGSASSEDINDNGVVNPGETDPTNWDSDRDGLSDGLERGLTAPEGQDTDTTSPHWQPDSDPTTKTDPLSADTNGDGVPDGEEDVNRNGRVDAGETDPSLVNVSLAQGWKHTCYVGEAKPIDQALATATDKVLAVYTLKDGRTFGRWFPGRPNVSTITTLSPWDQLFVLGSEVVTWNQQFSGASQGSVTLAAGWNSVCYSGAPKDTQAAVAGIAKQVAVVYALQADQSWSRYVPGRLDVSTLTQAARLAALLILVTQEGGATWVFSP